jgi:hypothetical protein
MDWPNKPRKNMRESERYWIETTIEEFIDSWRGGVGA